VIGTDAGARPFIGRPLPRREDRRLITGQASFVQDLRLPGRAHLVMVRSVMPAGRITAIDTAAALELPGVVAVWTAKDLPELGATMPDFSGGGIEARPRPVLAGEVVHYEGEAVAAVIAESPYAAQDAADAVLVEMDPLPAVTEVGEAARDGAPVVHADLGSNRAGTMRRGYGDAESAFRDAPVVVCEELRLSRIMGAAMEPRAAAAAYDPDAETLRVWASTQWVYGVRDAICRILHMETERVVVVAPDVGGGFGAKGLAYPEEVVVAAAARRLGRPVGWVATRGEDLATTVHGHGTRLRLELAAEADGRLRGLRGRIFHDMGAYASSAVNRTESVVPHLMSMYHLPAMAVDMDFVYTNCAPTGFIRGGGRPIGNFGIERLMDRLARRLDMDPVELRRRNLVQPEEMPYDTGFPQVGGTVVYDGGDYPALLRVAMETLGYDELRGAQTPGLGIGVACCVESTGLGRPEPARVRVERDGSVRLFLGSTPYGQGHETTFAQVLADRLGVGVDDVEVIAGDSRAVPSAGVTAASRSAVEVGNAVALAGAAMRRELLERAAEELEVDVGDLELTPEGVSVRGAPTRALGWADLVPDEGLEVLKSFDANQAKAYSSSCHAAVVRVDPETGHVDVLRYVVAHDTGRAINPLLLEGQLQGGYVHGLGYALFEEAAYEPGGSLLSSTFLDYEMAGAPETSAVPELHDRLTPTMHNPEGFKGAGEAGTIPVPAAITNAIEDALRRLGIDISLTEIPVTPSRLFTLLHANSP
jgi:aerobic carbon-monoxide dehydrogenase large subunit